VVVAAGLVPSGDAKNLSGEGAMSIDGDRELIAVEHMRDQIDALKTKVARLTKKCDDANSQREDLDKQWSHVYESDMGQVRAAVGNPDATVAEIVAEIERVKAERDAARKAVHDANGRLNDETMKRVEVELQRDALLSLALVPPGSPIGLPHQWYNRMDNCGVWIEMPIAFKTREEGVAALYRAAGLTPPVGEEKS